MQKSKYQNPNKHVGKVFNGRKILRFVKRTGNGPKKRQSRYYRVECLKCKKRNTIEYYSIKYYKCWCQSSFPVKNVLARTVYSHSKYRMKKKGWKMKINTKTIKKYIFKDCYYCGSKPQNTFKHRGFEIKWNGIDRIDSLKTYEPGNIVTCCKFCNSAKKGMTQKVFQKWLNQVLIYQFNGK